MVHGKRIQELALQIAQDSKKVSEYLDSRGLPQPSFSIDCPVNLMLDSSEAEEARLSAISASWELADLLQGPVACLRPAINASSLEAIYRWNIPACVPTDGSEISFSALAEKCQLSEPNLRRIVRYAILYHRVFQEPRVGFVTHSAASILLVNDPATFDTLGMMFDESWQAFARVGFLQKKRVQTTHILTCFTLQTCDALQSFDGQEPNETVIPLRLVLARLCIESRFRRTPLPMLPPQVFGHTILKILAWLSGSQDQWNLSLLVQATRQISSLPAIPGLGFRLIAQSLTWEAHKAMSVLRLPHNTPS